MHRDKWGLIVQADGDGGDTAQRTGMYYFGRWMHEANHLEGLVHPQLAEEFATDTRKLEDPDKPGFFWRHPNKDQWWSRTEDFSRDQQDALVIALGAFKEMGPLRRLYRERRKRFFRYQNKDVPTLQAFGVWIRAFQEELLYPVLWLTDLGLLINAVFIWASARKNPDDTDDINHIMRLAQAYYFMPTPVSWLARKLYGWLRPHNLGSSPQMREKWVQWRGDVAFEDLPEYEGDPIMGSIVWYFRAQNYGNPEIGELYRDFVLGKIR